MIKKNTYQFGMAIPICADKKRAKISANCFLLSTYGCPHCSPHLNHSIFFPECFSLSFLILSFVYFLFQNHFRAFQFFSFLKLVSVSVPGFPLPLSERHCLRPTAPGLHQLVRGGLPRPAGGKWKDDIFSKMAASAPGLHQLVRGGLPRPAGGKWKDDIFPIWRHQHLVCTNWFEVDCHAQLAVSEKPPFFQNGGLRELENQWASLRPRHGILVDKDTRKISCPETVVLSLQPRTASSLWKDDMPISKWRRSVTSKFQPTSWASNAVMDTGSLNCTKCMGKKRENWIIYRGPCRLSCSSCMIWVLLHTFPPLPSASCLSFPAGRACSYHTTARKPGPL